MRFMVVLPMAVALAASACTAKPADNGSTANTEASAQQVASEPLTLKAADGVAVHGLYYKAASPKALVLLFHQAGSSKDEYATIAPRLVQAGFSALAIDQRSGGDLFGKNETAVALGHQADYLEARPDLQAALDWAQQQNLPIVLWGSSYSSALVFPLAAGDPQGIVAVLAFSPGEYFDDKQMIRAAAAKVRVPVLIASTNSADETGKADPIMAALPRNPANVRLIPEHAEHGSSMLIPARNPDGAEANWRPVLDFLDRVTVAKK